MSEKSYASSRSKANTKWAAANVKQFKINLNVKTEQDLIQKLESAPNKQQYIKAALRAYMESER